jgi:hypothetical protein
MADTRVGHFCKAYRILALMFRGRRAPAIAIDFFVALFYRLSNSAALD